MPRRYEEEINEILNKFDGDWPPPNERRRPRPEPPHRNQPPAGFGQLFEHLGPQQVMAFGLLLILVGVVLRFGPLQGLVAPLNIGGYATTIGVLLLVGGYILAVVRGGSGGGLGRGQHFWRGQVVDLRPSQRGLGYWWWRVRSNLRRR